MAAIVLVLNSGQYVRNYRLYGSPLGADHEGDHGEYHYANAHFGLKTLASNASRNLALELGTPIQSVNDWLQAMTVHFHRLIHADVEDPGTTWDGTSFAVGPPWSFRSEDLAPAPLHVLLFVAAVVALLFGASSANPSRRPRRLALLVSACVVADFALFSGYLRWSPWPNRLMLPLLILAAPVVGAAADRLKPPPQMILATTMILLLYACALCQQAHPLQGHYRFSHTPRIRQYLSTQAQLSRSYQQVAIAIRRYHFHRIGLDGDIDDREYPLWVMLGGPAGEVRLEHVNVHNASSRFRSPGLTGEFIPQAIITIDSGNNKATWRIAP